MSQSQSQHRKYRHLSRECLCRGDAYLGPDVYVCSGVGLTGYGAAYAVYDAEDHGAALLGYLYCGQRVGRLAALAYGNYDLVGIDHNVIVAVFAGVCHLGMYAAEVLDELLADKACMPRRAARYDGEAPGRDEALLVLLHGAENDAQRPVTFDYAAAHAILQYGGLVEDLLEHEVREAALVEHRQIEVDLLYFVIYRSAVQVLYLQLLALLDERNILVVEIYDPVGIFGYGACVAGDEELPILLAYAYCQRRGFARGYHLRRDAPVYYGDGVGSDTEPQGGAYACGQIAVTDVHYVLDELYEYLGVGLALEGISTFAQLVAQRGVVLDDAVVYDGQVARLREVRVGVRLRRDAVRGPARMGYAERACLSALLCLLFEI